MSALADASASQHPRMFKVMMQLMKLRVIVLLQITAICAILVHDTFARYGVMDVERTWADTFAAMLITVVGGTLLPQGVQIPSTCGMMPTLTLTCAER